MDNDDDIPIQVLVQNGKSKVCEELTNCAEELWRNDELTIEFLDRVQSLACQAQQDEAMDPYVRMHWSMIDRAVYRLNNESEIVEDLGNTLDSALKDGITRNIPHMQDLLEVIEAATKL